jgi:hypothetical protein
MRSIDGIGNEAARQFSVSLKRRFSPQVVIFSVLLPITSRGHKSPGDHLSDLSTFALSLFRSLGLLGVTHMSSEGHGATLKSILQLTMSQLSFEPHPLSRKQGT